MSRFGGSRFFRVALLWLLSVSLVMAGVQWLVGPARGARDLAYGLVYRGHPAIAAPILRLVHSRALQAADKWWQLRLNYPRNWMLTQIGFLSFPDHADLFSLHHQPRPWFDVVFSAVLVFGTVMTYGIPLWLAGALRRRCALASSRDEQDPPSFPRASGLHAARPPHEDH
jgi:hypothetical protein